MDSMILMEELVFSKMLRTLTHRFNMDANMASELALELVEMLYASNANFIDMEALLTQ